MCCDCLHYNLTISKHMVDFVYRTTGIFIAASPNSYKANLLTRRYCGVKFLCKRCSVGLIRTVGVPCNSNQRPAVESNTTSGGPRVQRLDRDGVPVGSYLSYVKFRFWFEYCKNRLLRRT